MAKKRGQIHCCRTYSDCATAKHLRKLRSKPLSIISDLNLATLNGAISRSGRAFSIAAGSPSHATFSRIVGGASSRDIRVTTPINYYVGQQWVEPTFNLIWFDPFFCARHFTAEFDWI